MRCPACNAANPEGSYICAVCGKQMRSAFERGAGPLKLGQAPERSAPLARVPAGQTTPANLMSERPEAYVPPQLGGSGWEPPAAPAAYISPLGADIAAPGPQSAEELDALPDKSCEEADGGAETAFLESGQTARAMPWPGLPGQARRIKAGRREATGAAAKADLKEDRAVWAMDLGELIGAARDRAEKLRIRQTPDALDEFDAQQGNTSGLGRGHSLPQFARGFSLGGLVPLGIFAFVFQRPLLASIGLVLFFMKWYPIYVIYIGLVGRQMAWQSRRFKDIAHFNRVMRQWDIAGLYMLPLYLVWWIGVLVYESL